MNAKHRCRSRASTKRTTTASASKTASQGNPKRERGGKGEVLACASGYTERPGERQSGALLFRGSSLKSCNGPIRQAGRSPWCRPLLALTLNFLLTVSGGCATWAPGTAALTRLPWTSKTQIGSDPSKTAQGCWATAEEKERAGKHEQAAVFYEQARLLEPQARDYAGRLARLYDRLSQDEAAEREYRAAIDRSPDDVDLLNDHGVFYLRRGQWAAAEGWFRRALEASPDHDRASVNLAIALGMQDRHPESYEAFARVVGPAAAYCNLGVLLQRQGQTDSARDHFEHALRLDPSLQPARQLLASSLVQSENAACIIGQCCTR